MKAVEYYCKKALEMGIDGAQIIEPRSVVTGEWVRLKCQFGCSRFGTSLCCPPHTPTPELTRKLIDSYQKAFLLHRGLIEWEMRKIFNEAVVSLETKMFLDGYYKVWSMGSGPCRLCEKCNLTGPCRHAAQARPSMEACGIDVFATARKNGFPIHVLPKKGQEGNIFGVILVE